MRKKKGLIIVLGVVIFVLLVLLFSFDNNSETKLKVGIMTLTTGDLAFLGQNIVDSAMLAREELGYDDKIEFIIGDVGRLGGGGETVSTYRKLVDVDGVDIIIGGMSSDGTMAVASSLDQDKVLMITPLTGGENIDNAADYLFRNGPSDVAAGKNPAKDIYEKFDLKKVALITDNAEYTLDISKHFRNEFKGEIVFDEIVTPDLKEYRTVVGKIKSKDVDAIVINTATGMSAAYILKELYEIGNTKPIFTNFLAFNENTLTIAGVDAVEGVYVYNPEFDETSLLTKDFFEKYTLKYGKNPPIPFHTTGTYDVVKMIGEAIDNGLSTGEELHDYLLENIQGWQGMNGIVSLDEKGNAQTGFVLKVVKDSKLVAYEDFIVLS